MDNLFPVLDISYLSAKFQNSETWRDDANFLHDENVKYLVKQLGEGFQTWGFLYVKGHQIPENIIQHAFQSSKEFFERTNEFKMKFKRGVGINEGFVSSHGEIFDETKPKDLKEAIDFRPNTTFTKNLLSEMPDHVNALDELFEHCKKVLYILLRLLALVLGIDTEYYVKLHSEIGSRDMNGTSLRSLYYPPIKGNKLTSNEHRRCREHTDYGTITLLFQDQVGGLEVQSPSGEFVKAVPIPGAIVINAGDLFNTWSNGKILATTHRVTIPEDCQRLAIPRQSIAFFSHPNYDINIEYTNQNGSLQTRNAYEHLRKRFDETIVVVEDDDVDNTKNIKM